jgi:DNA-binding MarR family transcriptional regulator
VRRRPDPADRRSVRAALTPAGQQAYQKGKRALTEEQQAIVKSLSTGEAASLTGVLELLGP